MPNQIEAEQEFNEAFSAMSRAERLYRTGALTPAEYRLADARCRAADAALWAVRVELRDFPVPDSSMPTLAVGEQGLGGSDQVPWHPNWTHL